MVFLIAQRLHTAIDIETFYVSNMIIEKVAGTVAISYLDQPERYEYGTPVPLYQKMRPGQRLEAHN